MELCITIFALFTLLFFCFLLLQLELLKSGFLGRLLVNIRKIFIKPGETYTSFRSTTLNLRGIINHFSSGTAMVFHRQKSFAPVWRVTPWDKVLRLHLLLYHKATADSTLVHQKCTKRSILNAFGPILEAQNPIQLPERRPLVPLACPTVSHLVPRLSLMLGNAGSQGLAAKLGNPLQTS